MRIQVVWNDLVEVSMENALQSARPPSAADDCRFLWPDRFGNGYTQFHLSEDSQSTLGITHGALRQNVRVRAGMPFTTVGLCFILSGHYQVNYSARGNWHDRRGECTAWYLPDALPDGLLGGNASLSIVELSISLALLTQWFAEEPDRFPRSWHPFLEGRHPTLLERSAIPPSLWRPLYQLLQWQPDSALGMLYMESKIHECIALYVAFLLGQQQRAPQRLDLSAADRRRVLEAALLIGSTLAEATTQSAVAQQVGLSESKLKRGFQQMFGTGVHGYQQHLRMEEARYLMDQHSLPVKQVAARIGHSKQGHFSRLFREHFGVNPKDYVKSPF
ncbi:helix-turn-helix domain-containing protein [Pantoea coffeiphila]|uniref:helix-turn-helix domain-containing protein n=1 Tax=Pantoea coffeiphila TaxID=1465635 RepID=UPI0019621340|nr:AraC family transcriptional regulator [Pantoea coffeiphila]MBM7342789.1 AraC-like DNA-binding protein [Pantoea coffeiphila]